MVPYQGVAMWIKHHLGLNPDSFYLTASQWCGSLLKNTSCVKFNHPTKSKAFPHGPVPFNFLKKMFIQYSLHLASSVLNEIRAPGLRYAPHISRILFQEILPTACPFSYMETGQSERDVRFFHMPHPCQWPIVTSVEQTVRKSWPIPYLLCDPPFWAFFQDVKGDPAAGWNISPTFTNRFPGTSRGFFSGFLD